MRFPTKLVLAGVLGFAAAILVACGGTKHGFPSSAADSLDSDLSAVADAVDSQNCQAALAAVQKAVNDANSLPDDVDEGLTRKLAQGLTNLRARAAVQCRKTRTTPTTTTSTQPTISTETATTQTQTQPTQTQTTQTQTTQTQSTPTQTTPTQTSSSGGTSAPTGGTGGIGKGTGGTG